MKKPKRGKKVMRKPIEEALAEIVSEYAKSGGRGGHMSMEQVNAAFRAQIRSNEESGEK